MADDALKEIVERSLNEEKLARAPMLRTLTSANPLPIKVVLMGRVLVPSTKGTSLPSGSNGREKPRVSRSRVHVVCLVMEEKTRTSGSSWSYSVKDLTLHPGPGGSEPTEITVSTNRSWSMKNLTAVEKREKEGAAFTLLFESTRISSSAGVGNETSYTWEGVSTAACDEILWGLLTLRRAARDSDAFEAVNISLKELDAMAVYHGLASKHPLVPQLARQMRSDGGRRSSAGIFDGEGDGKDMHSIGIGGRRSSAGGMGGPRASDVSRESVDKARRLSKQGSPLWDYEEFEQGEAVLGRLKWLEKGREGLLEELSEELDGLEGGTIQQARAQTLLIAWSKKTDETETLISMLDEVDQQLQVMEGWLELHGKPLEAMQVDMAQIERKNNILDVQWRNYQNLDEYLRTLVKAISITPSTEALLRNPQAVLDAALASTTGSSAVEEDDPGNAVEKVVTATDELSKALSSTEQLAAHESTSSLQLLPDQRNKLVALAEITCSQLSGFCRRLLKRLTLEATDSQEGQGLQRRNSVAGDTSSQRLLHAQRQFHGYLIDYEPIFAQVRKLDEPVGSRSVELEVAYGEDLGQGLLKTRIRAYFGELLPRIVYHRTSAALASMERASMGYGTESSPKLAGPNVSLGQLTPVSAMKQCLEHTMPAIAREQAFFSTLFGLDVGKDPRAKEAVERMLRVGFAELISTHKRIAADLHDNPLDSLGVLTLVENAQLKQQQEKQKQQQQQQQASLGIVLDFKALLVQRFSKFIEEQARKRLLREGINSVTWIQGQKGDAKKAGILAAVAKVPTLLRKLQASANAAIPDPNARDQHGEAQKAYQKLVNALFKHIEDVASSNPKYEHMVRLENYHFFAATICQIKVQALGEYVAQAEAREELATTRYLDWLVAYQFSILTQFFARVEELVTTVGAADVSYHEPKRTLESALKKEGSVKALTEGLRKTHERMMKHVSRESQLMEPLWDKLSDTLFAMFSRYEELCTLCYQHTLHPKAGDVRRVATEIGGGGTPSRNRSPKPGDLGERDGEGGMESPPSSAGGYGAGRFGSFSDVASPTMDAGVRKSRHRASNSSQISATSSPGGLEGWASPSGGISSPIKGRKRIMKHLLT
ncbi:unnamed protein product [Ascophyllum nodosum]